MAARGEALFTINAFVLPLWSRSWHRQATNSARVWKILTHTAKPRLIFERYKVTPCLNHLINA